MDTPVRVTDALSIPASELSWRFSRSSGPGGQGVNTADSRVELLWDPTASAAVADLSETLRERLLTRVRGSLVNGSLSVVVSENRAQLRNRATARERLAQTVREALAPPPRARRATRPTRGSVERRLTAKKNRSSVKANRTSRGHAD
ncbi:protein chain release factor B [Sanguibacter keddieii DSM 10542]|uniref:Protein chain release factor B n=1 Tax=Sanguibacter keddieii (strain ATCC 51767 / DSM 10542 / NCFB 3025 / ST-74) TaxID=446469 RepID=D1BB31_SANKS|nr:alternative ribosome rescue aminoacyl-tRNA hydrolase ArfB [Sanguibacter keddieii]ACZ22732.1 protein chain release factor B [Sanguibacter keddieii DSM 10542]